MTWTTVSCWLTFSVKTHVKFFNISQVSWVFNLHLFDYLRHSKLCLLNFERMIVNANSFSTLIFDFSYGKFFWNFCFVCFSFHFANHSIYLRSKCIRTWRVNLKKTYGIIIQFQSSKCIWIEFSFRNIIPITKDKNYKKNNLWMILYGLFSIYHRRNFSNSRV